MNSELVILDGGMGQELLRRGGRSELWSAKALIEAPDLVREVHREYIAGGAQIIITNTYSTIPSYLDKGGMADRYEELADLAGRIAREAADGADHPVEVAGSLPPLDESYRSDLVPPDAVARPIYERLARTLLPHVDLFICETMSSIREARNATTMALVVSQGAKPVYVSWTLAEEPGSGLRSGEPIEEAVAALADLNVEGFLFNCTSPAAIEAGLAELRPLTDKPIGAYPNKLHIPTGWTLDNDVSAGYADLDVSEFLEWTDRWRALGATIIGGCCGIGPEYIAALGNQNKPH